MFQVPASKASIAQNRFDFELNGQTYSIPKLQFIKPSVLKKLNGQDAEMLVLGLVDEYYPEIAEQPEVAGVAAAPATDSTPAVPAVAPSPFVPRRPPLSEEFESLDQMLALYEAWATASGMNVGESSGSSDSSTSTAEPSTETSSSSVVPSEEETTTAISVPTA